MELLKLSHKIILIDSSIEAYRVAKRENIIYHIGEFDEAPSILYNAIIDYTYTRKYFRGEAEKWL